MFEVVGYLPTVALSAYSLETSSRANATPVQSYSIAMYTNHAQRYCARMKIHFSPKSLECRFKILFRNDDDELYRMK